MGARVALTVDLEPDWGVGGARAYREVLPRFLKFLEERGARATFFVVSDLLDVDAGLVADIAGAHEVASHGATHRRLDRLDVAEVERELTESRMRLQEVAGCVDGFRAPFFARCDGLSQMLQRAGYRYDASLGTVWPGLGSRRIGRTGCPHRRDGMWQLPTSSICAAGLLPLSLTWLRLLSPVVRGSRIPASGLIYLHLHEFLPRESAAVLGRPLRWMLRRNCGEPAWDILDRTLTNLDAELVACCDLLPENDLR